MMKERKSGKERLFNIFTRDCEELGFLVKSTSNSKYRGPAVTCRNITEVKEIIRTTEVGVKFDRVPEGYLVYVA